MAQGFKEIQKNSVNEAPGYKTLFERITEKTGGEKKSYSWYLSAVKSEMGRYKKNFNKYTLDEKADGTGDPKEQDENELCKFTIRGHLYMFEYKAKMKWLPYYDRFPLVYVLKSSKEEFWGLNLHYLPIKKRIIAAKKLIDGKIDVPKVCFHKYIHNHVQGLYIDLALVEWDTAILLPTEDFVKDVRGVKFPINKEEVWKETNEKYYDKIMASTVNWKKKSR